MQAIICETGLSFGVDEYTALYGNAMLLRLQRKYTVRTVDRMTKMPRVTKLFRITNGDGGKIIELPRFTCRQLCAPEQSAMSPIKSIIYNLPIQSPIDAIQYTGKSNPNQEVVVKHVVASFRSSDNICGMTIKVAPGLGKSFIAKDIINQMKLKTLIVVPNTYLLDQWVSLLRQYFPGTKIGTLYGKRKEDGDIIVGIINTIAELQAFDYVEKIPVESSGKRQKYERVVHHITMDDLLRTVGLAIFDESHLYVSKEFKKVFRRVWARYTIGLSATPDIREDKLDVIHRAWLGPILDAETLDGFNAVQDTFSSQVDMIEYHALNEHCSFNVRDNGIIDYASIVESIINDPNRNGIIIDETIRLAKRGLYTFVFSDRRSHLERLYELLEAKLNGVDAVLEMPEANKKVILYGGSDEQTIAKAKQISTVVFTTYSYSSTGVSITKMNGLILATPRRSNMTQIIGRVFRLGSDTGIKRVIVDISDAKLPLKSQVRERMKAYRERGCDIVKKEMHAVE